MKLKFEPINIDPSDPFKSDLLSREDEVKNLTALVNNTNSPAVLAIDSRWGTGKTTFIKLWEQHLIKEEIPFLYFNAWETDFSEDPLVAFLGEINESLKPLIGTSTKSKKAWSKTKTAGKQIAKRAVPVGLKIATFGALDTDKVIEAEIAKAMGSLAGDALKNYTQQKNAIKEFHKSLKELIALSSKDKPVVIFVDELDRCRPTYAIALLERIKHLFNIEGIVFVLALDKEQLGHSISSVYGQGIDTNGYLRRFIDFEYNLQLPELDVYIRSLYTQLDIEEHLKPRAQYEKLKYDNAKLLNTFILLARTYKLTLRETEQLLTSINLAVRTANNDEFLYPSFLAFLIITKNIKPDLYNRYIANPDSDTEIVKYLRNTMPATEREDSYNCAELEAYLIIARNSSQPQLNSEMYTEHKDLKSYSTEDIKEYSKRVINTIEYYTQRAQGVNLSHVVDRIEMLKQFKFTD